MPFCFILLSHTNPWWMDIVLFWEPSMFFPGIMMFIQKDDEGK